MSAAARQAATERGIAAARRCGVVSAVSSGGSSLQSVWNFGFGANINPNKLTKSRGIHPLEIVPGRLPGWQLRFSHRGGFGNIHRVLEGADGKGGGVQLAMAHSICPTCPQPAEVHGVLLQLSLEDFGSLAGMEHQYRTELVRVLAYDGREIDALAFVSPVEFQTRRLDLLPTERYMGLIFRGAREMKLDLGYRRWLDQIPCIGDRARGSEYYDCGAQSANGSRPRREEEHPVAASSTSKRTWRQTYSKAEWDTWWAEGNGSSWHNEASAWAASAPVVKGWAAPEPVHGATTVLKGAQGASGICFFKGDSTNTLFFAESQSHVVKALALAKVPSSQPASYARTLGICAGAKNRGIALDQLHRPWRLAALPLARCTSGVDATVVADLYVTDRNNNRVQRWSVGSDAGASSSSSRNGSAAPMVRTVAGGNGAGSRPDQLDQPVAVAVHPVTRDVYVSDRANHRVVRWRDPATVTEMSSTLSSTMAGEVVCGGNGFGDAMNQLACPAAIHVTSSGRVYVADEANNRVVRWDSGSCEGVIVVGGNGAGSGAKQLYHPLGLYVAEDESYVLVGDSLNYRVQRWDAATNRVTTVAGGDGLGASAEQLGQPHSMAVDEEGNLFIADSDNKRIQCSSRAEQERVARLRTPAQDVDLASKVRFGICTMFKGDAGYGFVIGEDDGKKYFAHHSDIAGPHLWEAPDCQAKKPLLAGYPQLQKGQRVRFEARLDDKWEQRATSIVVLQNKSM